MIKDTRNTSRIEILNFVVGFCSVKYYGENQFATCKKENSFHSTGFDKQLPPIGSLCRVEFSKSTKWYLGWLKKIKDGNNRFDMQYLIESIEDGSLCWWSNISISHLPLETTDKFPEWKWTDKQWDFKKRWWNACYKKRDAYIIRPMFPVFNDDGSVVLKFRQMFSNGIFTERKIDNWKKATVKEMVEFYDYSYKENDEVKTKSSIEA